MDYMLVKDPSGLGDWIVMKGCPRAGSHARNEGDPDLPGPTFSSCATCSYQAGDQFEVRSLDDDWNVSQNPTNLRCGYPAEP